MCSHSLQQLLSRQIVHSIISSQWALALLLKRAFRVEAVITSTRAGILGKEWFWMMLEFCGFAAFLTSGLPWWKERCGHHRASAGAVHVVKGICQRVAHRGLGTLLLYDKLPVPCLCGACCPSLGDILWSLVSIFCTPDFRMALPCRNADLGVQFQSCQSGPSGSTLS